MIVKEIKLGDIAPARVQADIFEAVSRLGDSLAAQKSDFLQGGFTLAEIGQGTQALAVLQLHRLQRPAAPFAEELDAI